MSIRRVLYQSVFWAPLAFKFTQTPAFLSTFTPFDTPRAPQFSAAEQQFSAWHSPFFGTKTPITPDWTAFDAPRAPQYAAAEQQFNTWHSPFFGTRTPSTAPASTPFDQPRAPQYAAAEQQFSAFWGTATQPPTLIKAFTSTPFDVAIAPQYKAAQQQFSLTDGFLPPANPVPTGGMSGGEDFVIVRNVLYQSEFSFPFNPPVVLITVPSTPFDQPQAPKYPAGEQQFTSWHSPFFGTKTPSYAAGFVPFDTPQAPKYNAALQQFADLQYPFVIAANTPNYLSTFYVDSTIPKLTVPPALLQFNDLPMGPEQTTAAAATIGRWGPDETKEERRRRHAAGIFFQWEEMPDRSEFAPDPVEHPAHEPQKWADEPAAVRTGAKASPVSGVEHLAAILADVPDETWDDPEVLDLIEKFLENGWRR